MGERGTGPGGRGRVRQLRLVVEAEDYAAAVHFYRDVLGLPEELSVASEGGAHVTVLDAGRATLELANPAQKRLIDEVEVGRQVAPWLRVAFEVDDVAGVAADLTAAGALQLAPPTPTPWRSLNARLEGAAGLQLTLFTELGPETGSQPPEPGRAAGPGAAPERGSGS